MASRLINLIKSILIKTGNLFLADPKESLQREVKERVNYILEYEIDDSYLASKFNYIYQNTLAKNNIKDIDYNSDEPLKTRLSKKQLLEIAEDFFGTVFPDDKLYFKDILNGEGVTKTGQSIFLELDRTQKHQPYVRPTYYPSIVCIQPILGVSFL